MIQVYQQLILLAKLISALRFIKSSKDFIVLLSVLI